MSLTFESIVEETRHLPADVVSELVDRILRARHGGIEPVLEASWKSETRRRIAEIESGQVEGIPGEEVSARLRKSFGS